MLHVMRTSDTSRRTSWLVCLTCVRMRSLVVITAALTCPVAWLKRSQLRRLFHLLHHRSLIGGWCWLDYQVRLIVLLNLYWLGFQKRQWLPDDVVSIYCVNGILVRIRASFWKETLEISSAKSIRRSTAVILVEFCPDAKISWNSWMRFWARRSAVNGFSKVWSNWLEVFEGLVAAGEA